MADIHLARATFDNVADVMDAVIRVEAIANYYCGADRKALDRVLLVSKLNLYLWASKRGYKSLAELRPVVESYLATKRGQDNEPVQKTKRRRTEAV